MILHTAQQFAELRNATKPSVIFFVMRHLTHESDDRPIVSITRTWSESSGGSSNKRKKKRKLQIGATGYFFLTGLFGLLIVELLVAFVDVSIPELHVGWYLEDTDLSTVSVEHHGRKSTLNRMVSIKPRIVYLDPHSDTGTRIARNWTFEVLESPCPYCKKESNSYRFFFETPYYEECKPAAEWQTKYYPTCNNLHEISFVDASHNNSLISMTGSWRSVWSLQQATDVVGVKLLHFNRREFDHESFEYHRVDAIAMERATASPYVVDIYSFCGQSVVTEWAPTPARLMLKNKTMSSKHRLKLGRDLARGFRDLHSFDHPDSTIPTFAHNDVNLANVVAKDGRLKINDFNIGILMRTNGTIPCGSPVRFRNDMFKSPEEILNQTYIDAAKADVYGLGDALFTVLTYHQPRHHLEPGGQPSREEVVKAKLAGKLPFFPERFSNSTKIGFRALYDASRACLRLDPNSRPTSHQVAKGLEIALIWARGNRKVPRDTITELFAVPQVASR